jgi:putative peptidoglycan lipid II flippase
VAQKWLNKLLNLWEKLTTGSTNRKIFGAALTIGIATVFVKLVAVVKELTIAWKFGISDDLDAFFIALTIPFFVINVVAGSFNGALVPTYIQLQEREDKTAAEKLFSGVTFGGSLVLIVITILVVATAPLYLPRIAGGFDRPKLDLTFHLLCAIAPFILLSGIIAIWSAVLNAGERFALAAISPILTPTITIILVLWLQSWGSFSLTAGLVCGAVLEIGILGVGLKRQGVSLLPKWYGFDSNLRQVVSQYAPTAAGTFLICSNSLVDQSMAAILPAGSVAALNYADKVVALPFLLIITALSTAIIPYLSKMVANEDWKGVHHTFKQYLNLIFFVTVPLTVGLILFSEFLVRFLFQRGSFTASDTHLVAQIQSFYSLKIPFSMASTIVVRLIISMQKNYILMWGSAFNFIINISLNYLFAHWMGVVGIALSTSCVSLFSFSFLYLNANKHLKKHYIASIE